MCHWQIDWKKKLDTMYLKWIYWSRKLGATKGKAMISQAKHCVLHIQHEKILDENQRSMIVHSHSWTTFYAHWKNILIQDSKLFACIKKQLTWLFLFPSMLHHYIFYNVMWWHSSLAFQSPMHNYCDHDFKRGAWNSLDLQISVRN